MRLIELNLNNIYHFTMSILPSMRAEKSGRIVNISSGTGIIGDLSDPHYATARGEVIVFSKEIACEIAKDHINTNCTAPGLVDTRMTRIRPWGDKIADTLWHRAGQPEGMVYAMAYMASAVSDYYTRQVLSSGGDAWMQ